MRRLAVPERQRDPAEVADAATGSDGQRELPQRNRRDAASSTKILNGAGGGSSDGTSTASTP